MQPPSERKKLVGARMLLEEFDDDVTDSGLPSKQALGLWFKFRVCEPGARVDI